MATDLADLVEPLKREVAVPGTFSTVFSETADPDLEAALLDAFAEAQLDGFLSTNTATDGGAVSPDLSRGAQSLVVIYAGVRLLRAALINRKSHIRYESKGNVFEQDYAASVMTQALKDLNQKKLDLIELAQTGAGSEVLVVDGYFVKATSFYDYETSSVLTYVNPYGQIG